MAAVAEIEAAVRSHGLRSGKPRKKIFNGHIFSLKSQLAAGH